MKRSSKKKLLTYTQKQLEELISKHSVGTYYEEDKPFTTFFIVEPSSNKYYMIEAEYKASLHKATYKQPVRVVKVMREEWEIIEDGD